MNRHSFIRFLRILCGFAVFGLPLSTRAIINRNLPFGADAHQYSNLDTQFQTSSYFCNANWDTEELNRTHIYNKMFDGTDLNLSRLFKSYDAYLKQNGKGISSLSDAIKFVYGIPAASPVAEPFANTKAYVNQLRFSRRFNGVFDLYLENNKEKIKFAPAISGTSMFFGASLPLIDVSRICSYKPYPLIRQALVNATEKEELVRTLDFNQSLGAYAMEAGLGAYYWRQRGIGDLTVNLGLENTWQYKFGIKRISMSAAATLSFPTAASRNIDNALSFAFGRGGWAPGLDLSADLELKHGLGIGGLLSYQAPATWSGVERVSISGEPNVFSPLKTSVKVTDGYNLRLAPYFWLRYYKMATFDLAIGVTFLRHGKNKIEELVYDNPLKSAFAFGQSQELSNQLSNASFWTSRYTNFSCQWSPTVPVAGTTLKPKLKLCYDLPWTREKDLPVHRFGASVCFDI